MDDDADDEEDKFDRCGEASEAADADGDMPSGLPFALRSVSDVCDADARSSDEVDDEAARDWCSDGDDALDPSVVDDKDDKDDREADDADCCKSDASPTDACPATGTSRPVIT